MSDKAAQYTKMFKKNIDRIVIAIMFLILGGLVFAWFQEQTGGVSGEVVEGKAASWEDPVAKNPHFTRVIALTQKPDMTSYPAIQQIALYNMFDYKSVRDKQEIERGADQRFAQAQDAFNKGNPEEARRLIGEILRQVPSHRKARELLEKINSSSATAEPGLAAPSAGVQ